MLPRRVVLSLLGRQIDRDPLSSQFPPFLLSPVCLFAVTSGSLSGIGFGFCKVQFLPGEETRTMLSQP